MSEILTAGRTPASHTRLALALACLLCGCHQDAGTRQVDAVRSSQGATSDIIATQAPDDPEVIENMRRHGWLEERDPNRLVRRMRIQGALLTTLLNLLQREKRLGRGGEPSAVLVRDITGPGVEVVRIERVEGPGLRLIYKLDGVSLQEVAFADEYDRTK